MNTTNNPMEGRTVDEYEMVMGDDFVFGRGFVNPKIKPIWNPDKSDITINPHLLIIGGSGAGKTRLLKKIIEYLNNRGKQVYVVDFHGDLKTSRETVYHFTARNSQYGLNPFEFEHDTINGGVEVQVRILTSTIKHSFFKSLGDRQTSTLMQFFRDCYSYVGIYEKDEGTWNKDIPTVDTMYDLYCLINEKINVAEGSLLQTHLNALAKLKKEYEDSLDGEEKEKVLKRIDKKFEEFQADSSKYYDYLTKGEYAEMFNLTIGGVDISWYLDKENAKSFKSLAPYIKDIHSSPVFNENRPPKAKGVVRYDLSGLTNVNDPSEAIFFSNVIAQRIFRQVKMRGEYRFLGKPGLADTFYVVDESKLALPTGTEKANPFQVYNRTTTESRKFGFGFIGATQRTDHFTPEMLDSIDTKVILRIGKKEETIAMRALGVQNAREFDHLKHQGVALVGQTGKNFQPVALPWVKIAS